MSKPDRRSEFARRRREQATEYVYAVVEEEIEAAMTVIDHHSFCKGAVLQSDTHVAIAQAARKRFLRRLADLLREMKSETE